MYTHRRVKEERINLTKSKTGGECSVSLYFEVLFSVKYMVLWNVCTLHTKYFKGHKINQLCFTCHACWA